MRIRDIKTQDDFSEYFYYDESSPSGLRWKVDRFCGKDSCTKLKSAGDAAGSFNISSGYFNITLHHKTYQSHRIVWEIVNGCKLNLDSEIVHKDGDRSNNKIDNLREVTRFVNRQNLSMYSNNKSGAQGVYYVETEWGKYFTATWRCPETRKAKSKSFNINKVGESKAFEMAVAHRLLILESLNNLGENYSERHISNSKDNTS